MPFLIAVIGVAVAAYIFIVRARNAAQIATELVDVANDVRLAARRFGFRRKTNMHPVESIDDPNIAIVAIAGAFLELDSLPTQQQRNALIVQSQSVLDLSEKDATEMLVLGRWMMTECGGAGPAVSRLSRKLYKMRGAEAFEALLSLIDSTLGEAGLNDAHREALEEIKRAFRLR